MDNASTDHMRVNGGKVLARSFVWWMIATTAAGVPLGAACAETTAPAAVEAPGPRLSHAVVVASIANIGGNPGLDPIRLHAAFAAALPVQGRKISEGRTRVLVVPQAPKTPMIGASHLILVEASINSPTILEPAKYNTCATTTYEGKCQGGMSPGEVTLSRVRLRIVVTEHATGKVVYRSDDSASQPVLASDRGEVRMATAIAAATFQTLKDAGLLPD